MYREGPCGTRGIAPATSSIGADATQEQVDRLTRQMRLARPLPVRYADFPGRLASGDLSYSTRFKRPVKDILWSRLGSSLFLGAIAFTVIVSLPPATQLARAAQMPAEDRPCLRQDTRHPNNGWPRASHRLPHSVNRVDRTHAGDVMDRTLRHAI